jgi:diacylglycerol kinase (ATP)
MHALLIHNPTAGTGEHQARALERLLREAGYSVSACSTKEPGYKKALRSPVDLILVAGGDGTVARVVRNLSGSAAPLAILPLGTANNTARSLSIEGDAEALLECIRGHVTRPLDVGVAKGPWGRRRFAEGVGVGLFTDWMQQVTNKPAAAERTKIGRETLREALVAATPRDWSINIDDQLIECELVLVEVLNTRFFGPALPLGPLSESGDGLLDVVYLRPERKSEMLSWLESPERMVPPLTVRQGRRVIVNWDRNPLHIDDRVYHHPGRPEKVKIRLESEGLRVCVPPPRG